MGRIVTATADFAEFLRESLEPLGPIAMRRMFGKTGVFCDGCMLGMVRSNTLYLRVDEINREFFSQAQSGFDPLLPLDYVKQGVTIELAFWRTPDRLLDDLEELRSWAAAALAAARRVAARRRPAARKQPR